MKQLIILVLVFSSYLQAKPIEIERIVAVVNKDIIMFSELLTAEKEWSNKQELLPNGKIFRERVLQKLIFNKLQSEYLRMANLEVTSTIVDNGIAQIAQNNKLTIEGLLSKASQQGISLQDLRSNIKRDIERSRLQQLLIPEDTSINKSEIELQIIELRKKFSLDTTTFHVKHIVVSEDYLAQEIFKKINQGENFAELASQYSNSMSALIGGDLGFKTIDKLPGEIKSTVMSMQPKQLKIFEDDGWHIVKLEAITGTVVDNNQLEQQAVHIIMQKKINRYLDRLFRKMQQESFIEVRL